MMVREVVLGQNSKTVASFGVLSFVGVHVEWLLRMWSGYYACDGAYCSCFM